MRGIELVTIESNESNESVVVSCGVELDESVVYTTVIIESRALSPCFIDSDEQFIV